MIEKIKELTKDTALYGISTIVGRFLGFILVPFYTNVFSPDEFGIQSYIYAFLAFGNIIYIYGMDAAFMKFATVDSMDKRKVFSTGYVFVFATTFVFSLILLISHGWLAEKADISEYSGILPFVVGILFLDTATLIPFSELRLERKAARFTTIKIINIIINVSLNFILILGFGYGIEAIFISNFVASAFSLLALIPTISENLKLVIDRYSLKKMLYFGLTYLPASIAAMIVQVIDVPIIRALTDEATMGIYRANYKLGIFMLLFVSMFHYAWQPFFLTNAKEENAKEIFAKVLSLFLIFTSLIWVVLSLFIDNLAGIEFLPGRSFIGKEYLSGTIIVPVILLAYIFHGLYINFIAGIYLEEKTKYLPAITGLGAAVNIVSNLLLVPHIGIMGGAISTLLSYFVMACGIFMVSQKFYKINYDYKIIIKVFVIVALISTIYYYNIIAGEVNIILKISLLLGYIILMFIFKVISLQDLSKTIKMVLPKN
jgi:O-antigen/teichoic acid export membrane protein